MLKLIVKRIAIGFSSFAAVLSVCQSSNAQVDDGLDVGRHGIQPGLEHIYLQHQLSGQPLNEAQGFTGCTVGFGLSCNKTGAVLQQLLESNNGPSYQELLTRAAGGVENWENFSSFYGNNPNLSLVPYASFWRNDSVKIMDGYQYVLGSPVSRNPVQGLGLVTKNFYWAPLSPSGNALSPRSGLLNLKYSYGRLLFEEASKIPNLEQQIQSLGLSPEMTKFYLSNLSRGLRALNSGNNRQLRQSILEELSSTYSPGSGVFGRPTLGIPEEFNQLVGQGLPGDSFLAPDPVALEGEAFALDIPYLSEGFAVVPEGADNPFLWWPFALAGGLGLLLLLTLGGGDDDSSSRQTPGTDTPGIIPQPSPGGENPTPGGGVDTPGVIPQPSPGPENPTPGQVIEIPPTPITPVPGQEMKKVPEPSLVTPLLLLIIVLCILDRKQRSMQIKG